MSTIRVTYRECLWPFTHHEQRCPQLQSTGMFWKPPQSHIHLGTAGTRAHVCAVGDNEAASTRTEAPLDKGNVPHSPSRIPRAFWKGASEALNAGLAPHRLTMVSCEEPLVRGSRGPERGAG